MIDETPAEGRPTSRQIVAAADEALWRAGAPLCYLHRDGEQRPFAVVMTTDHLNRIGDLVPPGEAVTELFMHHGHVEGDDESC